MDARVDHPAQVKEHAPFHPHSAITMSVAVASPSPPPPPEEIPAASSRSSSTDCDDLPESLPLRRATIDLTPFLVSSRYSRLRLLGRGSCTVVASALDAGPCGADTPPRPVAIKKIPDAGASTGATRRLLREVRILRALSHPHLLPVSDVAASPSHGGAGSGVDMYLVTPLAAGGDLGGVLHDVTAGRRPRLSDATTRRVMGQLLAALASMHAAGIVHRDVKPDNIFLSGGADGVGDVWLGDFGLSRHIAPRRSRGPHCSGASVGGGRGGTRGGKRSWFRPAPKASPITSADDAGLTQGVATRGYRAPELVSPRSRSRYNAGIDLWSAGVVLAEALLPGARLPGRATKGAPLAGKAPFDAPAWVAKEAAAAGVAPPPADAVHLLGRLLEADPAKRATAAEAAAHPYVAGAVPPLVAAGGGAVDGGAGASLGFAKAARLEPPSGAGRQELARLLWAEVTAFHPELEVERPLLGGGAGGGNRLGALLRRR